MTTLNDTFSKGVDLYGRIDTSPLSSTDPGLQEMISQAIALFEDCMKMVRSLALFSSNESVEDISTNDLQFLLAEAYLGDLVARVVGGASRLKLLESSKIHWTSYLTTLEVYDMLDEEHRTAFRRISDGSAAPPGTAKRREEVIARHKRKQKLEADMETLRERKARGIEDDDELERELVLAKIASFVEIGLENLEMGGQELDLLRQREKDAPKSTGTSLPPGLENGSSKQQKPTEKYSGPLLSSTGKPLTNFTLVNERQRLQQRVFGPDHSLPTLSIEDYLERERERGNFISGGGSAQRPEKPVVDDMDAEAVDQETYKQRHWDDWKDDNPKGHGNRKGKG